ncbi:MAG TPA: sulfotransferase [Rhizomicrobium sp.]|jgi:tetratricopeptide (TPR) repeat protein|nr:sulfotransferase [Rhizomicrobium sp.]
MTAATNPSPQALSLYRQADEAVRRGDFITAASHLARSLALAPGFLAARQRYATLLLHNLGDPAGAAVQIDRLLEDEPRNAAYLAFRAAAKGRIGDYAAAIAGYEKALAVAPADAGAWLRYGHALKTAGRADDAVAAYRRSLDLRPGGEAWWSLADLKSVHFTAGDAAAMRALLQRNDLAAAERAPLHFALGKALEDAGDAAAAFAQYALGNALKRAQAKYDATAMTAFVARAEALFTPEFFAARAGQGSDAPDPIFIVGLPRSGSTLVEQILASHSAVEGTMELPDLIAVARQAMGAAAGDFAAYPGALATLDGGALKALGDAYIARTRVYRREGKPFFIDKMPDNFVHTGLIHLILPRAKIIDVRRRPLACGWSVFKQHFAAGEAFSYDLGDIGRYYADYVRLMAHVDAVLPGRVLRVDYETLVGDTEAEIRRLLAACNLPFEAACLRFHDNRRAVRTASAQQVRRPIFREGLESWRAFEPWLGPLKAALEGGLTAS